MTFSLSIPRLNSGSSPVLNASTGAASTAVEDTKTSGTWTPTDGRDTAGAVSSDATATDHTLSVRSLAVQDGRDRPDDPAPRRRVTRSSTRSRRRSPTSSPSTRSPSPTRSRTDSSSTAPSRRRSATSATAPTSAGAFDPSNYSVVANGDGTSTVIFDVSAELIARGFTGGSAVGGCIPNAGVATPNCATTNLGKTQVTIAFRTTVQNTFTNPPPGRNASVDQGDVISDSVTISGKVLDTGTLAQTGSTVSDSSGASLTISGGSMAKTVYAINGVDCPCGSPIRITAGDTVTYAISYTAPFSAIESFTISDYLPLPIFEAAS